MYTHKNQSKKFVTRQVIFLLLHPSQLRVQHSSGGDLEASCSLHALFVYTTHGSWAEIK